MNQLFAQFSLITLVYKKLSDLARFSDRIMFCHTNYFAKRDHEIVKSSSACVQLNNSLPDKQQRNERLLNTQPLTRERF